MAKATNIKTHSSDPFYWDPSISREKISALIKELEETDDCLEEISSRLDINIDYIVNYNRADFIYFLKYVDEKDLEILDLGSGFGNITIPLSKKLPNAKIFATDASYEILRLLELRAERESCENIEFHKVGIFENGDLPFPKKKFDIIILNGVLEWIGYGQVSGNPRDLQIKFLTYLKTLLKDDGVLYIGIENRFFPGYFKNVKDPHSGLKYTSVVPRRVADWICRLNGQPQGYRNYIYTTIGYKRLFNKSGFDTKNLETVYPVASYKDPFFLFSCQDRLAYRWAFSRLYTKVFPGRFGYVLYRILYFFGLEKIFAPSYLFLLGNSSEKKQRLLDRYIDKYLNSDNFEPIKILGNLSSYAYLSFILLNKEKRKPEYILKIKRYPGKSDSMAQKMAALEDKAIKEFVLPINFDEESQLYHYIENQQGKQSASSLGLAIKTIKNIHRRTKSGDKKVEEYVFSKGLIHGDYTLENILIDKSGVKIIDMEDVEFDELQIFDICSLLTHYYSITEKTEVSRMKDKLLSKESLELLRMYDSNFSVDMAVFAFRMFFEHKAEKTKTLKRSRYKFYAFLAGSFSANSSIK